MFTREEYKLTQHNFPSDDISPAQKNQAWHMAYAEALYAAYINGQCSIRPSEVEQMRINVAYGAGNQDKEQYKEVLIGPKSQLDGKRKGYAKVDFDKIISVAPKFRRIIIGKFLAQEHDIECDALDENAGTEREDMKWRLWAQKEQRDVTERIANLTEVKAPSQDYEPVDLEELDLYSQMGGFKLNLEIALEMGLAFVDYDSDWQTIKEKIIGDAIDKGVMVVKDYIDIPTQKVKKRYVDPMDFIYSIDQDGGICRAAEYRLYTIESIRRETGLLEQDLYNLAYEYRNHFNNGGMNSNYNWADYDEKTASYRYNTFQVPVLECEFASIDTRFRSARKTKDGSIVYFDEPWRQDKTGNYLPPAEKKTDNRSIERFGIKVFRKCKWIIGTKICWDWGLSLDVPRPVRNQALSSYHVQRLDGIPLIQQCIPDLDQIQLANLRIQNALAMAPNSGIAYEYSSLQGMKLGGKSMDPMDIIRMQRQTGSFVYKATTHRGGMISPMAGKPVQELKGGIGPLLNELITIISVRLQSIRDITGVGQGADASTPPADLGLGVQENVLAATNDSLRPIYSKYIRIKESSSRNCALRLKLSAKMTNGFWAYDKALGKPCREVLSISADFTDSEIGIRISARPTAVEIADMENTLRGALQSGQSGKAVITMSEYFAIKRQLRSGASLKFAQILLAYRERKFKEAELALQDANMQQNTKNQMLIKQQDAAAKKEELQFQHDLKLKENSSKADDDIRVKQKEHEWKMEEISAQASQKAVEPVG